MLTTLMGASFAAADIIVLVLMALGLLGGLIGGLERAFRGIFASLTIMLLSLLIVGLTVAPLLGSSLGGSLTDTFTGKTQGWGDAYTCPVYINRAQDGSPIMDGDNYTYYIEVQSDGGKKVVTLDSLADGKFMDKIKGQIAVRLARRYIRPADAEKNFEGTEGQTLAGVAAKAITTLIFDVVLFIVYCIVLGILFKLLRKLFNRLAESDSGAIKFTNKILGAVVGAGLALIAVLFIFAIIKSAVPDGSKVANFFESASFAGELYKNNPMSKVMTKIFG